ncbi:hypothetical protein [Mycobacterium sp.]|uniref:hypothetical protein n=1 Tax=Mycobacterium sp. TaxID=1785 RepID=UPI003C709407
MRCRINIVAPTVVEVVKHAGGWVFDRMMAGWHVVVIVGELVDDRPLRILGAKSLSFETAVRSHLLCEHPQSLAVPTDLFETDSQVRSWVLKALEHGLTQVALWGRSCPPELSDNVDIGQHRLTTAARAFKAQALVAAGVADVSVADTENFHAGASALPPVATDLVPVHTGRVLADVGSDWCGIDELKTASAVT